MTSRITIPICLALSTLGVSARFVETQQSINHPTDTDRMTRIDALKRSESALTLDQMRELLTLIFELEGSLPVNVHTMEKVKQWEFAASNLRDDSACRLYRDHKPYPMPSLSVWCSSECYLTFEMILQQNGLIDSRGHRTWRGGHISSKVRGKVVSETLEMYRSALEKN